MEVMPCEISGWGTHLCLFIYEQVPAHGADWDGTVLFGLWEFPIHRFSSISLSCVTLMLFGSPAWRMERASSP